MRKLRFFIYLIFLASINCASCLSPRYAAIVIEAESGRVLEQEGADVLCHPASLTKILTLYMVFEALKTGRLTMNTQIPVSAHAARQAPTKLGLRAGEHVTVETVIKGLVTKSANDAAAAIAEYLGGSESHFATLMTQKAKKLGMHHSVFKNASGLPNPRQITTARDMATLSRALYLHFPKDYRHFRLQAFHFRGHLHRNHNHLLGKVPGVDGIKTGWIAASGSNLAASAVRMGPNHKPRRLIAVVLGGANRHWRDRRIVELLEANFKRLGSHHLTPVSSIQENQAHDETDQEDEEDIEVTNFLKEEKEIQHAAQSTPVNWSPSPSPAKPLRTPAKQNLKKRNEEKNSWGVQIGAYKSIQEARINAKKTLSFLQSGEISTPRVAKGKKSFYGARLLKLTREEAEKVCKKHTTKGKECRILAEH